MTATSYVHLHVSCPGGAVLSWEPAATFGDLWQWPCAGASGFELPTHYAGVEYVLRVVAGALPVDVRVWGGTHTYPDRYTDGRNHLYHWSQHGPDFFTWPLLVGSFTPRVDHTSVIMASEGVPMAEIWRLTPEPALVAVLDEPVPDLEAGVTYNVRFSVLASCQPECWAHADLDIRGYPVG